MNHVHLLSKPRVLLAQTSLGLKLDAAVEIMDRLLLAQRQAGWKTPFPLTDDTDDTTDTTTDTTI